MTQECDATKPCPINPCVCVDVGLETVLLCVVLLPSLSLLLPPVTFLPFSFTLTPFLFLCLFFLRSEGWPDSLRQVCNQRVGKMKTVWIFYKWEKSKVSQSESGGDARGKGHCCTASLMVHGFRRTYSTITYEYHVWVSKHWLVNSWF